jgi:hypothetical protein
LMGRGRGGVIVGVENYVSSHLHPTLTDQGGGLEIFGHPQ